jgi:hypothetical protein
MAKSSKFIPSHPKSWLFMEIHAHSSDRAAKNRTTQPGGAVLFIS